MWRVSSKKHTLSLLHSLARSVILKICYNAQTRATPNINETQFFVSSQHHTVFFVMPFFHCKFNGEFIYIALSRWRVRIVKWVRRRGMKINECARVVPELALYVTARWDSQQSSQPKRPVWPHVVPNCARFVRPKWLVVQVNICIHSFSLFSLFSHTSNQLYTHQPNGNKSEIGENQDTQ